MAKRLENGWLILLGLLLIAAAPVPDTEDLVRQGNAAFARGEYDQAADLYRQAAEATTDPGLVAFNEATALAGRGQFADAQAHFWLCLGDPGARIARLLQRYPDRDLPPALRQAAGPRLARVLYNLGTCALQDSQGKNADLTEQAVVFIDHCLRQEFADAGLRANALHNLELAKEFLRLNPRPPAHDNKSNADQQDDKPPRKDQAGSEEADNGNDPDLAKNGGRPMNERQADPGDNPQATDERTPGKGNLAPLLDQDALVPMSSEDAASHLRQALQRIMGERREYQQEGYSKPSSHVLDW